MELAYIQTMIQGYGGVTMTTNTTKDELSGATTATTTTTTTTTSQIEYIRLESWTDVFVYELCFLYFDVMFVLYLVILLRSALKRHLTLSLPIMAANWMVGMLTGLSAAVVALTGPNVLTDPRIWWQLLVSLVVGVFLCFLSYGMVMEMITIKNDSSTSSSSCSIMLSPCPSFCNEGMTQPEQDEEALRENDPNNTRSSSLSCCLFQVQVV
jgi:hypothetical protein